MRILCTFPGRYGDLLWALPTVRALSRRIGAPIDLQIAGEFASLVPLLQLQPYLQDVCADERWSLTPPDEWAAPPLSVGDGYGYTHVFNLGYRGWPQRPLPFETLDNLHVSWPGRWERIPDSELDLSTPWITLPTTPLPSWTKVVWVAAFTEAHFELKFGLWELLTNGSRWTKGRPLGAGPLSLSTGTRWQLEAGHAGTTSWVDMAQWMLAAPLLLTDCSAPHVLAVALGTPTILCEPMEARWNSIFYPLGMGGPQVTVVKGNDGLPTFDSRHVGDAIEQRLQQLKER